MPDIRVLGVCPNRSAADRVVGNLRLAGFPQEEVAVMMVRRDQAPELGQVADQHGAEATIVVGSVIKGALIGAAIGLAGGFLTLLVPSLFVISRVILLALFTFSGAFVGALSGAFASEDVSNQVINRYGMALREGQAVVSITAPDAEAAKAAEELLTRAGATNVNSYLGDETRLTDQPGVRDVTNKPGAQPVSR